MKTILGSLALFFMVSLYAQDSDKLLFRATYQFTGMPNPDQPSRLVNSYFYLDAGNHSSFFYDPVKRQGDSIMFADMNMTSMPAGYTIDMRRYNRNNPGFQARQNWATRKIKIWDDLGVYFSYEEEGLPGKWQLHPDTMRVTGMLSYKATIHFRGRSYTAWYTPEIPVSTGPWKLSGLPGLILKVSDSLNHYKFECTGLENMAALNLPLTSTIVQNDRKTTYKDFSKLRRKRVEDPQGFAAAITTGANVSVNNPGGSSGAISMQTKLPFNPIELTDD